VQEAAVAQKQAVNRLFLVTWSSLVSGQHFLVVQIGDFLIRSIEREIIANHVSRGFEVNKRNLSPQSGEVVIPENSACSGICSVIHSKPIYTYQPRLCALRDVQRVL